MEWTLGTDLAAHRAAVQSFLAADPVELTTQATVLANLATGVRWSDVPPVFARHRGDDGRVDATAVMTAPHPVVLDGTADPAGLAAAIADRAPVGVNAAEAAAEAFAAAWCGPRGLTAATHRRMHLLGLPAPADLVDPGPPRGAVVRPATLADLPRVLELLGAMRREIGEGGSPEQLQRERIAAGLLIVLEVAGAVLATAQSSPPVAGVARVAGVYTEPAARGRGYAAAVTAAVTRAAFGVGAQHLCLFTDAANPTSNGVYERLGYRRRPHDRVVLRFG